MAATAENWQASKLRRKDWLGALATFAMGLPGGNAVVGPFEKLRQDEKNADRREDVDRFFRDIDAAVSRNEGVSREALAEILDVKEQSRELTFAVEVLHTLLHELVVSEREKRNSRAALSALQDEFNLLLRAANVEHFAFQAAA